MIKVIIADDEAKVCQLIEFLVDWKSLNMEIMAIVHNGIDALKAIKQHEPDIIITDIKMPGCDGLDMIEQSHKILPNLEYIVISGYKQFEYAQKAIQYGVSNYLLKPIDKEELTQALEIVKNQYHSKKDQLTQGEKLKVYQRENRERNRQRLFEEKLLSGGFSGEEVNIDRINKEYQYNFCTGIFQTVAVKIDGIHQQTKQDQTYIENKIVREMGQKLKYCMEWQYFFGDGICFLILNYAKEAEPLHQVMDQVLRELLIQTQVFEGFQVTIGLGQEGSIAKIFENGFKCAKWAVDQRLLAGTNRVIQGQYAHGDAYAKTEDFSDFNDTFYRAIELQDVNQMLNCLRRLETHLMSSKEVTGYIIYQMCKEAVNVYIFALRKLNMPINTIDKFFEQFRVEIHNYGSAHETFTYLRSMIKSSFTIVMEEKQQQDVKPIRLAKLYITEHLGEPISLEIVSDVVGFNTAYFSTIFKKETGSTFSEYLLNHRIEKAKELLRDTRNSVSSICMEVGYNDVKYFTKKFTQYTSLKPKEYRKLYS